MQNSPDAVAVHNGEFFGLDPAPESKKGIRILKVPWDVTTSYRAGTVEGPEAILQASYQLDLFSPHVAEAWEMPIRSLGGHEHWKSLSQSLRVQTERYIAFLEEGGKSQEFAELLQQVNAESRRLNDWVENAVAAELAQGNSVITLGGDHSVPMGAMAAAIKHYPNLSVLHFDAHADLREAYEGFEDSHASIMYNVLKRTPLRKLVQVGVRDYSSSEFKLAQTDNRISCFFDWELKQRQAAGEAWKQIVDEIIQNLSEQVYVSFDIDGLDPKLCPGTGTPVPGGLEFWQAEYILTQVVASGRKIVGADLVEVAPDPNSPDSEWDANVGARMLFLLSCLAWKSMK